MSIGALEKEGDLKRWLEDELSRPSVVRMNSVQGLLDALGEVGSPGGTPVFNSVTPIFNVKTDFGAIGDGVTNDDAAFQDAYDAAQGDLIFVPSGTYALSSAIDGSAGINLMGAGVDETILLQNYNGPVIEINGSVGASVSVTTQVDPGDNSIVISSTSGMAAGDFLRLQSTLAWPTPDDPSAVLYGEVIRILTVDSATGLTLQGRVDEEYLLADTPVVYPLTMVGSIGVSDLTIKNAAPGTRSTGAVGISMEHCRDILIENVKCQDLDFSGMTFDECVDFAATDCQFTDLADGAGYGVEVKAGARDGNVHNCRMRSGRHLFTNGAADGEIPSRHIKVSDCLATQTKSTGFDTHDTGRFITFSNCVATNSEASGFNMRSPDSVLQGCVGINTFRTRINEGAARTLIEGCFFRDTRRGASGGTSSSGIVVEATDVTIKNTRIRNCDDRGIELRTQGDNLRIENVEINSPGLVGTANGVILRVGSGHSIDGLYVHNASSCIRIESGATLSHCGIIQKNAATTNFFSLAGGVSAPACLISGSGSPESVHAAGIGSVYQRTDGGSSTSLYVKEATSTGSTGWVAVGTGAAPGGAAGGALDGTYPNPGIAASVAGAGLTETTNVLAVGEGHGIDVTADAVDVDETELNVGGDLTGTVANAQIASGAVGGTEIDDAYIITGAYAPTTTNVTNIDSSSALSANYIRVGDRVTVSGRVSIDATAAGAIELGLSLPIASNFGSNGDCAGVATSQQNPSVPLGIGADVTNDRAQFIGGVTATTSVNYYYIFTYEIV
jgi:polygalacturonase